jgi:hypothetical protein
VRPTILSWQPTPLIYPNQSKFISELDRIKPNSTDGLPHGIDTLETVCDSAPDILCSSRGDSNSKLLQRLQFNSNQNMASLFSVSRFIPHASNTSWVTDSIPEDSQNHIAVDSASSVAIIPATSSEDAWKANSHPETPRERKFSYPPTLYRNSKIQETLEEPGYDVVPAHVSFGEWTDTDGPAEKVDAEYATQFEESPCTPSVPDWTHLEFDGGMMFERQLKQERAGYLEEICIVKRKKEKLAERVRELKEELHEASNELLVKMEQIRNFIIDHDQKEVEIETLKEENEHIQQMAAREKLEFLNERRSNEAIAARWQVEKQLKDARIAELEFAGELQAKKLVEKEIMIAGRSDTVAALERQKCNLISQIKELKIDKIESQARIAEMESAGEEVCRKGLDTRRLVRHEHYRGAQKPQGQLDCPSSRTESRQGRITGSNCRVGVCTRASSHDNFGKERNTGFTQ